MTPTMLFTSWGERLLWALSHVGNIFLFGLRMALSIVRFDVDGREVLRQLDRLCLRALPLLLAGSALIGGIVALQGLNYVARYNATEVFGWATALSAYQEVGPLLLGLALAARVGTKNAAELATMRARERLMALTALGLDVERCILRPRALAIFLCGGLFFPLCTAVIMFCGFIGAALLGEQNAAISLHSFMEYTPTTTILLGGLRMLVFSLFVGVLSTYFGNAAGRDPRSLGRAVYASSITGMTGIVTANLYLSFLGAPS